MFANQKREGFDTKFVLCVSHCRKKGILFIRILLLATSVVYSCITISISRFPGVLEHVEPVPSGYVLHTITVTALKG